MPHACKFSQVALVVKNLAASEEDVRDAGVIPGSGRSPGGGQGNPLQYSCLENPMNRGAWWATVHGVTQSRTQLKRLSTRSVLGTPDIQAYLTIEIKGYHSVESLDYSHLPTWAVSFAIYKLESSDKLFNLSELQFSHF